MRPSGSWNRGRQLRRLVLQDGVHHLDRRIARKRPLAAEHLIKHDAEAEQVRTVVGSFATHLLRRHIAGCTQHHAFIRQVDRGRILCRAPLLGQTKIQDLDLAVARDHDVVRLQIAMHQAGRVRRCQPDGHLHGNLDGLRRGKRSCLDHAPQGFPADQFGSDPVSGAVAADVVDGDDVVVIQGAGRARFPLETGDAVRIARQTRRQHLDGHIALQPRIARAPDFAHAAASEQFHNLEVAQPCAGTERADRRHRRAFQKGIGLLIEQRLHFATQL